MNQGTVQRTKDLRCVADEALKAGRANRNVLDGVMNRLMLSADEAERELQMAIGAAETALLNYQFEIDKLNRVVASTQGNPGLMQALNARHYDADLKAALGNIKKTIVEKLQKEGSTATKVREIIAESWPNYDCYNFNDPKVETAYWRGGAQIKFWYRRRHGQRDMKPTLEGNALALEAMRALKIPDEADVQKAAGPVDGKSSRPSGGKKNGGGSKEPAKPKENPQHPSRVAGKRPSRRKPEKKKATALTAPQQPASEADNLRHALAFTKESETWNDFWENGATNAQIREALQMGWSMHPDVFAGALRYQCRGTEQPEFSYGPNLSQKLSGAALIDRVRELLELPTPEGAAAREQLATDADEETAKTELPSPAFDAPQRLLYEAAFHTVISGQVWHNIIERGATDPQIFQALEQVWGRDAKFTGEHPDGKYDVNLKKKRVILRMKGEANKQIIRTLEGDALIHQVRAVLKIPQHPLAPAQSKSKSNGHAAPNDPASIEAGAFAGAGA